jgi:hypothetical protein
MKQISPPKITKGGIAFSVPSKNDDNTTTRSLLYSPHQRDNNNNIQQNTKAIETNNGNNTTVERRLFMEDTTTNNILSIQDFLPLSTRLEMEGFLSNSLSISQAKSPKEALNMIEIAFGNIFEELNRTRTLLARSLEQHQTQYSSSTRKNQPTAIQQQQQSSSSSSSSSLETCEKQCKMLTNRLDDMKLKHSELIKKYERDTTSLEKRIEHLIIEKRKDEKTVTEIRHALTVEHQRSREMKEKAMQTFRQLMGRSPNNLYAHEARVVELLQSFEDEKEKLRSTSTTKSSPVDSHNNPNPDILLLKMFATRIRDLTTKTTTTTTTTNNNPHSLSTIIIQVQQLVDFKKQVIQLLMKKTTSHIKKQMSNTITHNDDDQLLGLLVDSITISSTIKPFLQHFMDLFNVQDEKDVMSIMNMIYVDYSSWCDVRIDFQSVFPHTLGLMMEQQITPRVVYNEVVNQLML